VTPDRPCECRGCIPLEEYIDPGQWILRMSNREFRRLMDDPHIWLNPLTYHRYRMIRSRRPFWLKVRHALGWPWRW